ncbi:hypothetical protein Tco_0872284 [Tanacetum coccineum]
MATNEETDAAGTDTRPPMLVESELRLWKFRIHRYIRGKPNARTRKKLDSEFNEEENKLEMAYTKRKSFLDQGLPDNISNNLNQTSTGKGFGNVEMFIARIRCTPSLSNKLPGLLASTSIVDPTAYVAHTTSAPVLSSTLNIGFQKQIPTLQQPAPYFLPTQELNATVHDGQIVTDTDSENAPGKVRTKERWTPTQYFKDKALLREQLRRKEMYVDEGPNAVVAFMANCHPPCNPTIQSNEYNSNDNTNLDNVDYSDAECTMEEHLDSDAETCD